MNKNSIYPEKIRKRNIFSLVLTLLIIILVYFSINGKHTQNQDFSSQNKEICHELSLISKSIAKNNKSGFEGIIPSNISKQSLEADKYIRDVFSKKIGYKRLIDNYEYPYFQDKNGYGIELPNKTILWFSHSSNSCDTSSKKACIFIFIDVNGDEKPNQTGIDRTVQKVYKTGIECKNQDFFNL